MVDPLFVYHIDHRSGDAEGISVEDDAYPLLNPSVVRSFAEGGASGVMSEVAALSEEMGLVEMNEGPPPLDEMAARLR